MKKARRGTEPGAICEGEGHGNVDPAEVDRTTAGYFGVGLIALGAWWLVYRGLSPFAKWFTFSLLTLAPGSR